MDETKKIRKAIQRVLPIAQNPKDVDEIHRFLESKEGIFKSSKALIKQILETLV